MIFLILKEKLINIIILISLKIILNFNKINMKHIIEWRNILDGIDPSSFCPWERELNENIKDLANAEWYNNIWTTYHNEFVTISNDLNDVIFKRDYFFTVEQIDEADIFDWFVEYIDDNWIIVMEEYDDIIKFIYNDQNFKEYVTEKYYYNWYLELLHDLEDFNLNLDELNNDEN